MVIEIFEKDLKWWDKNKEKQLIWNLLPVKRSCILSYANIRPLKCQFVFFWEKDFCDDFLKKWEDFLLTIGFKYIFLFFETRYFYIEYEVIYYKSYDI